MSPVRSPWWWIPTLYFAEGIPYFVVNNISVILLTRLGVPNETMALYTSLLYLPWVIKPFWSPFVDIIRTKRWWIVLTEALMAGAFLALTFSIPSVGADTIASGQTPIGLFTFTLVLFWLTAFASATHDIAADGFYMLALDRKQQTFFVGIRSTFYRLSSIFGQGVLVMIAGWLEERGGDIPAAWRATLMVTAVIFALVTLYHTFFSPRPSEDRPRQARGGQILRDFGEAFATFFRKGHLALALAFMLLYRFAEALMLKLVGPFFLDSPAAGGLGLSTAAVGFVNGTVGVAALVAGGILGGIAASRWGLRRCLFPMAAALILPCLVYVWMSAAQPSSLWAIGACVGFEQFGYGFGFQAYMLYLMRFSEGEFKTSHYAICTGFMALSMMIPGLFAGYIWRWVGGYHPFFWLVMACGLVTFLVTLLVRRTVED